MSFLDNILGTKKKDVSEEKNISENKNIPKENVTFKVEIKPTYGKDHSQIVLYVCNKEIETILKIEHVNDENAKKFANNLLKNAPESYHNYIKKLNTTITEIDPTI